MYCEDSRVTPAREVDVVVRYGGDLLTRLVAAGIYSVLQAGARAVESVRSDACCRRTDGQQWTRPSRCILAYACRVRQAEEQGCGPVRVQWSPLHVGGAQYPMNQLRQLRVETWLWKAYVRPAAVWRLNECSYAEMMEDGCRNMASTVDRRAIAGMALMNDHYSIAGRRRIGSYSGTTYGAILVRGDWSPSPSRSRTTVRCMPDGARRVLAVCWEREA